MYLVLINNYCFLHVYLSKYMIFSTCVELLIFTCLHKVKLIYLLLGTYMVYILAIWSLYGVCTCCLVLACVSTCCLVLTCMYLLVGAS